MSNINSVVIGGNLVADCEKVYDKKTPIINFTIAFNDRRKNSQTGEWEDYANFIDCTMFGNRAKGISKLLLKGTHVTVLGHLRQSRWEKDGEKRSKVSVIAEEVEIFIPKSDADDAEHDQLEIPW